MQNEMMDAVTRKLYGIFGEEYRIYTDEVEQDFTEPCFYVAFLSAEHKPMLGNRYQRIFDLSIQFFPGRTDPAREISAVTEKLMDGMEYVTLADGRLRRGREMSSKENEGVLTFLVTYDLFGRKPGKEAEQMEVLSLKGGIL